LPVSGVVTQGFKGVQGTVSGTVSGDSEAAMKGLKQIYGIAPVMNTAAVGVALAIANTVDD
jgi:broad specificity polyphosphatase/5'/3'-nucleotidase SurE